MTPACCRVNRLVGWLPVEQAEIARLRRELQLAQAKLARTETA